MVVKDVEDQGTIDNIQQSVAEDFVEVTSVHAVDISFWYDDAEIEPLLPIAVVMSAVEAPNADHETVVVHVDDNGETQLVDSEATGAAEAALEMPAAADAEAQVFEADTFSVYALVTKQTIETKYIDDHGDTWRIKVDYGKDAKLPEGASLQVSEVTDETYLAQAEAALESGKRITKARFFDIKIMDGDREVQPDGQVKVTVTLVGDEGEVEAAENQNDIGNPDVVAMHFVEQDDETVSVEKQSAVETDEGVVFHADGFSAWGVIYTVDFEVEGDQGEITLDFTAFDATTLPEEGEIYYDTEDCCVHVALGLLTRIIGSEAEAGYDIDVNAALVDNYEFDFDKAEMGKSDSGMRFEDGELIIASDGFVELTEGERLLRVRATGLTALKQALLETEGVSIEVISGNVPLGSEASYTAHTDEETAELVENYINNEENGDVAVAGYSAADLKIVRNDETLPVEGQFKVTVDKASLVPVGMKLDKLYHIHRNENDEAVVEELEAVPTEDGLGLVFEVENFSDIVAGYTIDFEYEGIRWSFPGFGAYSIESILAQIGVQGEIESVDLLLIEGEESEYALYLAQDENGVWYLCSGVPFDETYRLTVVVDGDTYIFTVTDEVGEADNYAITVNLYDYDGATSATSEEIAILSGRSYGIVAVLENSNGDIVGYNKTTVGAAFSGSTSKDTVYIDKNKFMTLEWNGSWWNAGGPGSIDPSNYNIKFRLYEDKTDKGNWAYKQYGDIISLPDSMTGYEFLAQPNGTVIDGNNVTMNLKRAYDKQYNIRFNIEPADMGISDGDEYYAFVTVEHATSDNTYGWTKITIPKGQSTVDFPITTWYNWNGNELPNEKFTGNERVTVQIYTNNQKSDGTKDGFNSFTSIRDSQVKVLVAEGSSINKYNLYYGARTSENVDASHLTNYYDNLYLRAPNGNISKGDIDALLEDATDFGYYTLNYVGHSGDIEATIGADYMDTVFLADFGYSSANVNVNRLKVLKIYTNEDGTPAVGETVEIHLKQDNVVVATKTGTTNADGRFEVEFEGLNSGDYDIEEVIDGNTVHGKGNAEIERQTIYYNFSIDKAHFANNLNVNYFGTLGEGQDLDKLKTMLQKANRVDVVILTDTTEAKRRIDAAKETNSTGKKIDVVLNGTDPYKYYDIKSDMLKLKQLSDDLATAQSSSTVRVVNVKASEMSENGMFFEDDGRYIVINIEMDQDTFCPMVYLDGQLLDSDYGQSGKSNSSHVLYNLRHNGTYYDGDVNTSKLGSGVILAPAANAHVLGGPFGGTIITDRVNRAGNELHSNNPNQIQTLNATIQNTIGNPTTGSLELRKEFSNTAIKDKVTYFTFEVQLANADMTKVAGQSFPASGLKKGDSVTFDADGKAEVLVRAGNSVSIANLPADTTFTVKEISTPETAHFTLDHYEVNGVRSNTGTIVAGDTQKAKVLNTVRKADLIIEKEVAGTTDEDKEFEFTLKLENKTTGAEDTEENWTRYPDKYKISVAGAEYVEVNGAEQPIYTFRLKAGQKAEIQDLVVNNNVIRYEVTETAIYINDTRYEIKPDNQPVQGYSNSDLVVKANYTQGDRVLFINKYSAETRVNFVAHKVMQGRDLAQNEFTFELREGSPTGFVIGEQKTNAADGTITFDDIVYKIEHRPGEAIDDCMVGATIKADGTREKVFTYYVCEVVPENPDPNIAYAEPIEVQVKVVDDGMGKLTAYYVQEGQDDVLITVYNDQDNLTQWTCALPAAKDIVNTLKTQQTLTGTKTLMGRDMEEGEKFYFNVAETVHKAETDKDETVVVATGEATGGANNTPVNIAFTSIEYVYSGTPADYPQTHTYTITEDTTKLGAGVTHNPVQSYTATVTVNYDASAGTFTASEPVYSEGVAFINNWEERYINFTVTKEWKVEGTAVYAPRTITFSVKKNGVDFDLTSVNIEQTNSGVGSFSVSGNTVTLTAGENGWPVVKFVNVPEATYVVEETATTGKLEDTTLTTGYALNGVDKASNAAAAATADNDAIVIKNSEEIPEDNRAELTLKKIWDPTQFTDDADKQTVTYELWQVAASGTSGSSGNITVTVNARDENNEIFATVSFSGNPGDKVTVYFEGFEGADDKLYDYSVSPQICVELTNGSGSYEFTIPNSDTTYNVKPNYFPNKTLFTAATQRLTAGGATPLIVETLTATPVTHATVVALGGTKYGEYEIDAAHWASGIKVTVPKSTGSTNWQYYVVEKDGDAYEATYTQDTGNTLVVTNHKKAQGALKLKKIVQVNGIEVTDHSKASPADGAYLFSIKKDNAIVKYVWIIVENGKATKYILREADNLESGDQYYPYWYEDEEGNKAYIDVDAEGWATISDLVPGDYEIVESENAYEASQYPGGEGWGSGTWIHDDRQLTNVALSNVVNGNNAAGSVSDRSITLTVTPGDTVSATAQATFTNNKEILGSLKLKKVVMMNGATLTGENSGPVLGRTYHFTIVGPADDAPVTRYVLAEAHGGADEVAEVFKYYVSTTDHGDDAGDWWEAPDENKKIVEGSELTFDNLKPGQYTITEDTVRNDMITTVSDGTTSSESNTITVNVTADETPSVEVTYTNDYVIGKLSLRKVANASTMNPVNGDKQKVAGTYKFTLVGPVDENNQAVEGAITKYVQIYASYDSTHKKLDYSYEVKDANEGWNTAQATALASDAGVIFDKLRTGDYLITETGWVLDSTTSGAEMHLDDITVSSGMVALNTVDRTLKVHVDGTDETEIKAVFTNELVPNTMTHRKMVLDVNDSTDTDPFNSSSEQTWEDSADYDIGDEIPYRVTGFLPQSDYQSKSNYYYRVDDVMQNLEYVDNSGHMFAFVKGPTDEVGHWYQVDEYFDITTPSTMDTSGAIASDGSDDINYLRAETKETKGLKAIVRGYLTTWGEADTHANKQDAEPTVAGSTTTINPDHIQYLQFRYKAKLLSSANIGVSGNANDAKVYYDNSAEPQSTGWDRNRVFTYKVLINKTYEGDGQETTRTEYATFALYKKYMSHSTDGLSSVGIGDGAAKLYAEASKLPTANASESKVYPSVNLQDSGNYYYVAATISNGLTFEWDGLDDGSYILVELSAPKGYIPMEEPIRFSIVAQHDQEADDPTLHIDGGTYVNVWPESMISSFKSKTVTTVFNSGNITGNITNQQYPGIKILKIDETTRKASNPKVLQGAKFKIEKWNGSTYVVYKPSKAGSPESEVVITDQYGVATFPKVEPGEYKIIETKVPDGYVKLELNDIFFSVAYDGQGNQTVTRYDKGVGETGRQTIDESTIISGVTFEQAHTARQGDAEYLPTVDSDKQPTVPASFTVGNTPGVMLPATGGVGTGVVYGAGAALMLLAVLGLILLNRKRTDGEGIR